MNGLLPSKKSFPLFAALLGGAATLLAVPAPAGAQEPGAAQIDPGRAETFDVLYTRDGNVLKGVIVEQVPGEHYRMALPGGSSVTIAAGSVSKITKERNPGFAWAGAPGRAPAAAARPAHHGSQGGSDPDVSGGFDLPPPRVHEGGRVEFEVAPSFPISDLGRGQGSASTGFSTRIRYGHEYLFGNFGVEPGFGLQLSRYGCQGVDGAWFYVGAQPSVKARLHLGMIAPFLSLGFGFDHLFVTGRLSDVLSSAGRNTSASGVGFDLGIGSDVVFSPRVSGGVTLQVHPGFASYEPFDGASGRTMAFISILFGVKYRI